MNALSCWIAALLYLVTLCFSAQQFWMNNKSTYSVCCSLTLQPTTNPVVTPQGWIFDKEAIITFILDKKKEYNKKLKKYEEQLEAEKQEFRDSTNREEEEARARFEATEKNIVTKRVDAFRKESDFNSVSNTATDSKKTPPPSLLDAFHGTTG